MIPLREFATQTLDDALAKERELEELLAAAKRATENAREAMDAATASRSFSDELSALRYPPILSRDIFVTGPFPSYTIKGSLCQIGGADLPMHVYRAANVVDLSVMFDGFFERTSSASISSRIDEWMTSANWSILERCDMLMLPIDLAKRRRGMTKCDLPNVTYAIVLKMLQRDMRVVVVDPIHRGTDATVRIVNLNLCLETTREKYRRLRIPVAAHDDPRALQAVFYQRGDGNPDPESLRLLQQATGLSSGQVHRVHLTAGKYDHGGRPTTCYADFKPAVARILTHFEILPQYLSALGKSGVGRLWLVMDEFSGYAAMTAVSVLAAGLDKVVVPLSFFRPRGQPAAYSPV